VSGVEILKETLAGSDGQGEERKMELIDEVVLYQRAVELAGPVLHDVLTGPVFQLGDFPGASPLMSVAFHVVSRRVVEGTNLGKLLILSR
jgi:hypothetical protein